MKHKASKQQPEPPKKPELPRISKYIPEGWEPCELPQPNEIQKKIISEIGPFKFDAVDPLKLAALHPNLERRQPLKDKDGWIYDGEWRIATHIREGKGTLFFPNGEIYQGYFIDDKYSIAGRYLTAFIVSVYEGDWRDDRTD